MFEQTEERRRHSDYQVSGHSKALSGPMDIESFRIAAERIYDAMESLQLLLPYYLREFQ